MTEDEIRIVIPADIDMVDIVGDEDSLLRVIEKNFEAKITVRGDRIMITGDSTDAATVSSLFSEMIKCVELGERLTLDKVRRFIDMMKHGDCSPSSLHGEIVLTHKGKVIRPKTAGQKRYVEMIKKNIITFGIGPAGTGKTYLAMAMAVAALQKKEVGRIILTRPAVEAGESLGFLPGTLTDKVDPYLRPLYDALFDMTDAEKGTSLIERGIIEIAPLAFMRGRTLNDSFVILDEAQNTTQEQMKMFLTRLGFGSKIVVTGDITQIDLLRGLSGLKSIRSVLNGLDDIAFCDLTDRDVVRHTLVAKIVAAYDAAEHPGSGS